jgi:hypothetical protein
MHADVRRIPVLMVQLVNVRFPYLFQFISESEFEAQKTPAAPADIATAIEHGMDRALEFVEAVIDTKAGKRVLGTFTGRKKVVYHLQLLCGWTLEPVVSYRIEMVSYEKQVRKAAQIDATVCRIVIKLSLLYNTAAAGARMFGYPVQHFSQTNVNAAIGGGGGRSYELSRQAC